MATLWPAKCRKLRNPEIVKPPARFIEAGWAIRWMAAIHFEPGYFLLFRQAGKTSHRKSEGEKNAQ